MSKFWKWRNLAENETGRNLDLYGTIAEESWFDDDVTPAAFKSELMSGSDDVTVHINSPGGDCIAASQIYTMLVEYPGNVTVVIDGLAASAASVIAMAGNRVIMAPTALMMIHNPSMVAYGDHKDMEKAIDVLNEVKDSIINAYEKRTNLSRAKLSRLMEDETWMNAAKAIELGFADEMVERQESGEPAVADAYAFSTRSAVTNLAKKIAAHEEPKHKPVRVPQGRNIEELMNRLNTIKNYL